MKIFPEKNSRIWTKQTERPPKFARTPTAAHIAQHTHARPAARTLSSPTFVREILRRIGLFEFDWICFFFMWFPKWLLCVFGLFCLHLQTSNFCFGSSLRRSLAGGCVLLPTLRFHAQTYFRHFRACTFAMQSKQHIHTLDCKRAQNEKYGAWGRRGWEKGARNDFRRKSSHSDHFVRFNTCSRNTESLAFCSTSHFGSCFSRSASTARYKTNRIECVKLKRNPQSMRACLMFAFAFAFAISISAGSFSKINTNK